MCFELLLGLLRSCNCNKGWSGTKLPTRLLYVGDPNEDTLILMENIPTEEEVRYIALSHSWGNLSHQEQQRISTTRENLPDRREGFSIHDFPQTFRDAVRVTRGLGLRYLWIDAFCIIQEDNTDFKRELERMEDVFASAYCRIAATSDKASCHGFLKRDLMSRYIHIQDASGRSIYVCNDMDDFDNDVEKALLNTRGWVLQERVLSHRTIHFTANHIYWECGEGVRCEDLVTLKR